MDILLVGSSPNMRIFFRLEREKIKHLFFFPKNNELDVEENLHFKDLKNFYRRAVEVETFEQKLFSGNLGKGF